MQRGELCQVFATFLEDRDGRALVRLANGSKTSVAYESVIPQVVRGHFVPSPDGSTVTVRCLDDDWSDEDEDFTAAARLLHYDFQTHAPPS
jgi:hypothetical protein